MKLAVVFPGIGYTCDKPLLYYAGKLAVKYGYEVKPVIYGDFPSGVKGSSQKMKEAFCSAFTQAEAILKDVPWGDYEEILFISKSIGTVVAAAFMKKYGIEGRSISYTPLEETFSFAKGEGIMFHGTKDPWAKDSAVIYDGCEKIGQTLYIIKNANHSLETGEVLHDIEKMQFIMEKTEEFIKNEIK